MEPLAEALSEEIGRTQVCSRYRKWMCNQRKCKILSRAVYHTQEHLILLQGQVDQQRAQLQKVQTKLQQEQEKARNSQKGFREIISEQIDRNSQVAMGVNQVSDSPVALDDRFC